MTASVARAMSTMPKKPHLYYLSAWFCPFAHRATLALEHHADHLTYEWIEALGWEKRAATTPSHEKGKSIATEHENWYHFKAPELMKHNPLGMVPTLVSEATFLEDTSEGPMKPPVRESLVSIEFVDELVTGGDAPILPACPYERARCRVAADVVNKQICSKYYHVLVRQNPEEQREGFEALLKGIEHFGSELLADEKKENCSGIFFGGRRTPGLVDYALFPWAHRIPVFEHYRGAEYAIPKNTPSLKKYHEWLDAMHALAHVKKTCPPWDDYLKHIGRYADGSARSKVANAVRDGRDAHQYDDEKDDTRH
jgi:glutathione S-transferase